MTALCNAVGCDARRSRGQFMCRPHWFKVPPILRQRVNQTWGAWHNRAGDGPALWLDYIEATDDARKAVAEAEGRLAAFTPDLPRIKRLHEARAAAASEGTA